jgi:antirestriction protein
MSKHYIEQEVDHIDTINTQKIKNYKVQLLIAEAKLSQSWHDEIQEAFQHLDNMSIMVETKCFDNSLWDLYSQHIDFVINACEKNQPINEVRNGQ